MVIVVNFYHLPISDVLGVDMLIKEYKALVTEGSRGIGLAIAAAIRNDGGFLYCDLRY